MNLTDKEKIDITCRSLAFLKQIEVSVLGDKAKLKELAKDDVFVSIIVARINDVKKNAKYIPECAKL